jgi:integrase/recombinase XerC/integrase/recombinase XerD
MSQGKTTMSGKPRLRLERYTYKGVAHFTKHYYLYYLDSRGILIVIPLYRDKDACWRVAMLVVELDKAREAGIEPDPRLLAAVAALPEKTQRHFVKWGLIPKTAAVKIMTLEDVIEKWGKYLTASQQSGKYVIQAVARAAKVFQDCGFKTLSDITRAPVQQWLHDFVESGKSSETAETYIRSVRAVCNWAVDEGIIEKSPLKLLKGTMRIKSDPVKVRKEFSREEREGLLSAALTSETKVRNMNGIDRWHLYTTAFQTGIRYGELYSLKISSFDLDAALPTVTIQAKSSKRRRTDVLPLRLSLVEILKKYFAGRDRSEKAFRGMLGTKGHLMVQHDLEVAGFPSKTEEGDLDFHAMRHTFISGLIRAGVNPKVVQKLARHSGLALTVGRYSHAQLSELSEALGKFELGGGEMSTPG